MPFSGSTDFALNGGQIVTAALKKISAAAEGQSLTAEMLADGLTALNAMVKTWQRTLGASWGATEGTLTLVVGQNVYTMGGTSPDFPVRPLSISSARLRDAGDIDRVLSRVSREEYSELPSKQSVGTPNLYHFDPQMTQAKLYLWPTPTTNPGTLVFTYQRALQDFDASAHDADLPQEWSEALIYNLAVRLAPDYGAPLRPDVIALAQQLKDEVRAYSAPNDSIFFQPERY